MENSGKGQSEQLIERLTRQILHWDLALPALVFLQVTRPLSFIASQGLLLIQPMLSFLYDGPRISDYAELLGNRANVDHLIAQLEENTRSNSHGDKEGE